MFTTLEDLKKQLLPESLRARDTWDAQLEAIGNGVAKAFEGFCNRAFERVEDDQIEIPGDRGVAVLPRYPVETVTAIEVQSSYGQDWETVALSDAIASLHKRAGILTFRRRWSEAAMIRITWTGGYVSESFPEDLLLAWYLQCRAVAEAMDILEVQVAAGSDGTVVQAAEVALQPRVKQMLKPYIRY